MSRVLIIKVIITLLLAIDAHWRLDMRGKVNIASNATRAIGYQEKRGLAWLQGTIL